MARRKKSENLTLYRPPQEMIVVYTWNLQMFLWIPYHLQKTKPDQHILLKLEDMKMFHLGNIGQITVK